MTKVRRQHKKKTFNTSINRKRLRNRLSNVGPIQCVSIKNAWNTSKSAQINMKDMGLAYDPNKALKIPSYRELQKQVAKSVKGDFIVTDDKLAKPSTPKKPEVIKELETDAKAPRNPKLRLPKAQVDFVVYLMDKYGFDYKAMARDRKNYYQDTWQQLRAKIKKFMKVPKQYAIYLESKGLLGKEIDEVEIKKEIEALQMDSD